MKKEQRRNPFWALVFLLYAALMLYLLFFRNRTGIDGMPYWEQVKNNYNLIPWYTVKNYWHILLHPDYYLEKWGDPSIYNFQARTALINILGNIAMFIPLGAFLPSMWQKLRGIFRTLIAGFFSIVLVEICQLFSLRGRCDVDDVLLNMIGILAGYSIWKILHTCRRKKKK